MRIFRRRWRKGQVPQRFIENRDTGGVLSGCRPHSSEQLAEIKEEYPGLDPSYLAFLQTIGLHTDINEFGLSEPIEATFFLGHQSVSLYRTLHGEGPDPDSYAVPLEDLVSIYETGGSWRYCLRTDGQDGAVYCMDFSGPEVTKDFESFHDFLDNYPLSVPD